MALVEPDLMNSIGWDSIPVPTIEIGDEPIHQEMDSSSGIYGQSLSNDTTETSFNQLSSSDVMDTSSLSSLRQSFKRKGFKSIIGEPPYYSVLLALETLYHNDSTAIRYNTTQSAQTLSSNSSRSSQKRRYSPRTSSQIGRRFEPILLPTRQRRAPSPTIRHKGLFIDQESTQRKKTTQREGNTSNNRMKAKVYTQDEFTGLAPLEVDKSKSSFSYEPIESYPLENEELFHNNTQRTTEDRECPVNNEQFGDITTKTELDPPPANKSTRLKKTFLNEQEVPVSNGPVKSRVHSSMEKHSTPSHRTSTNQNRISSRGEESILAPEGKDENESICSELENSAVRLITESPIRKSGEQLPIVSPRLDAIHETKQRPKGRSPSVPSQRTQFVPKQSQPRQKSPNPNQRTKSPSIEEQVRQAMQQKPRSDPSQQQTKASTKVITNIKQSNENHTFRALDLGIGERDTNQQKKPESMTPQKIEERPQSNQSTRNDADEAELFKPIPIKQLELDPKPKTKTGNKRPSRQESRLSKTWEPPNSKTTKKTQGTKTTRSSSTSNRPSSQDQKRVTTGTGASALLLARNAQKEGISRYLQATKESTEHKQQSDPIPKQVYTGKLASSLSKKADAKKKNDELNIEIEGFTVKEEEEPKEGVPLILPPSLIQIEKRESPNPTKTREDLSEDLHVTFTLEPMTKDTKKEEEKPAPKKHHRKTKESKLPTGSKIQSQTTMEEPKPAETKSLNLPDPIKVPPSDEPKKVEETPHKRKHRSKPKEQEPSPPDPPKEPIKSEQAPIEKQQEPIKELLKKPLPKEEPKEPSPKKEVTEKAPVKQQKEPVTPTPPTPAKEEIKATITKETPKQVNELQPAPLSKMAEAAVTDKPVEMKERKHRRKPKEEKKDEVLETPPIPLAAQPTPEVKTVPKEETTPKVKEEKPARKHHKKQEQKKDEEEAQEEKKEDKQPIPLALPPIIKTKESPHEPPKVAEESPQPKKHRHTKKKKETDTPQVEPQVKPEKKEVPPQKNSTQQKPGPPVTKTNTEEDPPKPLKEQPKEEKAEPTPKKVETSPQKEEPSKKSTNPPPPPLPAKEKPAPKSVETPKKVDQMTIKESSAEQPKEPTHPVENAKKKHRSKHKEQSPEKEEEKTTEDKDKTKVAPIPVPVVVPVKESTPKVSMPEVTSKETTNKRRHKKTEEPKPALLLEHFSSTPVSAEPPKAKVRNFTHFTTAQLDVVDIAPIERPKAQLFTTNLFSAEVDCEELAKRRPPPLATKSNLEQMTKKVSQDRTKKIELASHPKSFVRAYQKPETTEEPQVDDNKPRLVLTTENLRERFLTAPSLETEEDVSKMKLNFTQCNPITLAQSESIQRESQGNLTFSFMLGLAHLDDIVKSSPLAPTSFMTHSSSLSTKSSGSHDLSQRSTEFRIIQ